MVAPTNTAPPIITGVAFTTPLLRGHTEYGPTTFSGRGKGFTAKGAPGVYLVALVIFSAIE